MKLDVGCGTKKKKDFVGIDKFMSDEVDVVFDLDTIHKGIFLPYEESSVDEINCSHVLEHVENVIAVMNDFHRILKPVSEDRKSGGVLTIVVPHARSWTAFASPLHRNYFVPETFRNYFASDMLNESADLELKKMVLPWHIEKLEWTPAKNFDISQEIVCIMRPLKERE